MVFFPVNLSGSGQPKVAGKEQVGCSERASYNQARQARPAGGWAGQPALRFGCPCWQRYT
ncbi:hypothetical protein ACJJIL_01605 [Microbulbifer sp. EKSA005]|uniref:hypothetical protein n=1 Tax=Microbulbifer sp. EKSA005 TaxID=3243364 RepID=UPI0040423E1A